MPCKGFAIASATRPFTNRVLRDPVTGKKPDTSLRA
jgi:hypothetical protein